MRYALDKANFAAKGVALFEGALAPCLTRLNEAVETLPKSHAGLRLQGIEPLAPMLSSTGCIGAVAAQVLGPSARPVRAIMFNKSAESNWSLAWHQDRTICVKDKRDAPGFGPWTIKSGMIHVAPPFDLLSRMVTIRAHIDPVPLTNAPLLVALGSHKNGPVAVDKVEEVVGHCDTLACIADAGDIWLYATPILHASQKARIPTGRRVLQVDFAAEELPCGLEWLGV